jgi:plastocyanin
MDDQRSLAMKRCALKQQLRIPTILLLQCSHLYAVFNMRPQRNSCRYLLIPGMLAVLCLIILAITHQTILKAVELPTTRATQPSVAVSGTVMGVVTSQGGLPLSDVVVYLSPGDGREIIPSSGSVKVSQFGAKFSPALVLVCAGQSVEFLNDESRQIEHNVFSNSAAKQFDLGLYKPGESRSVEFDKPGAVFLYCSIHRFMDGVVYVTPTPYFSRVGADGKYEIDHVPPGDWVIRTWQRQRRFPEIHLDVKVAGDQRLVQDLLLHRK